MSINCHINIVINLKTYNSNNVVIHSKRNLIILHDNLFDNLRNNLQNDFNESIKLPVIGSCLIISRKIE